MDRPRPAPPASARPAVPPAGPRFQFGFLYRGEKAVYLKCARRRFGLGMALTPIASVALVFMAAAGADAWVLAALAVALLACVWSLVSGPRTVLDEARGWIWTAAGEPLRFSQIVALTERRDVEASAEGSDVWTTLSAVSRAGGDPIVLAESLRGDALGRFASQLALRMCVPWMDREEVADAERAEATARRRAERAARRRQSSA